MNRTFTIKTTGGIQEKIEVSPEDTFEYFCEKIRSTFNFEADRKLRVICAGKIITENDFKTLPDKVTMICLATKPTDISPQIPNQPIPQPVQQPVQQPVPQATEVNDSNNSASGRLFPSTGETYSFKQVQAYTIVFLNFISSNPQLREAFLNNYGLLVTELAKNQQLEEIMKNILSQSGQIMEAMEKGENIKLNINTDSNSMDKIELTREDTMRIDQLIAMGFNPDKVVVAYLKSGKNMDRTLQALTSQ